MMTFDCGRWWIAGAKTGHSGSKQASTQQKLHSARGSPVGSGAVEDDAGDPQAPRRAASTVSSVWFSVPSPRRATITSGKSRCDGQVGHRRSLGERAEQAADALDDHDVGPLRCPPARGRSTSCSGRGRTPAARPPGGPRRAGPGVPRRRSGVTRSSGTPPADGRDQGLGILAPPGVALARRARWPPA